MSFRTMKLELQGFTPELNAIQLGLRLNRSYQHLLDAHPWSFLDVEALVKFVGPITTGTIDVTEGLATVIGNGTAWAAAQIGYYLRTSSNFPFYKVTNVDPATQTLTLEVTYGESTAVTQPYRLFKHIYNKPTDCKHIMGLRYDYNMPPMVKAAIDTLDPERSSTGQPFYWGDVSDTQFEVWPVPDQNYTVRMWYRKIIVDMFAETDTCLIPERLVLKHAQMAAYQQLSSSEQGAKTYLPLYQTMVQENQRNTPGSFSELWQAAIEEDMRKFKLPTTVRVPGFDVPQSNDYWMQHDATDPRRWM